MSDRLRVILFILVTLSVLAGIRMIHRGKLSLKYSLLWLGMALALIIAVLFPEVIYWLAGLCGVDLPINMLFTAFAFFSLLMIFSLTSIVSQLNDQNRRQTQQLALLEKRLRELEKADQDQNGAE